MYVVSSYGLFYFGCGIIENGVKLGCSFKEFGGFVVDDLYVLCFVYVGVMVVY